MACNNTFLFVQLKRNTERRTHSLNPFRLANSSQVSGNAGYLDLQQIFEPLLKGQVENITTFDAVDEKLAQVLATLHEEDNIDEESSYIPCPLNQNVSVARHRSQSVRPSVQSPNQERTRSRSWNGSPIKLIPSTTATSRRSSRISQTTDMILAQWEAELLQEQDLSSLQWQHLNHLRMQAGMPERSEQGVALLLKYFAQLCYLEEKCPLTGFLPLSTPFTWTHAFTPQRRLSLPLLDYEKASVLFNLAALYSQLGVQSDLKQACAYFQKSAGCFMHVRDRISIRMRASSVHVTSDLKEETLTGLVWLMLAQAAECFYEKASQDSSKVLSQVAQQCADLYANAYKATKTQKFASHYLPKSWVAQIKCKTTLFQALVQISAPCQLQHKEVAEKLARLHLAKTLLKKAQKQSLETDPILQQQIQQLLSNVEKQWQQLDADNEMIYKQAPVSEKMLPDIKKSNQSIVRAISIEDFTAIEDLFSSHKVVENKETLSFQWTQTLERIHLNLVEANEIMNHLDAARFPSDPSICSEITRLRAALVAAKKQWQDLSMKPDQMSWQEAQNLEEQVQTLLLQCQALPHQQQEPAFDPFESSAPPLTRSISMQLASTNLPTIVAESMPKSNRSSFFSRLFKKQTKKPEIKVQTVTREEAHERGEHFFDRLQDAKSVKESSLLFKGSSVFAHATENEMKTKENTKITKPIYPDMKLSTAPLQVRNRYATAPARHRTKSVQSTKAPAYRLSNVGIGKRGSMILRTANLAHQPFIP